MLVNYAYNVMNINKFKNGEYAGFVDDKELDAKFVYFNTTAQGLAHR